MSNQKWVVDETGGHYVDLTANELAQQAADEAAWQASIFNPPPPSTPVLTCLANLAIDSGDVQSIESGATGLAFAFVVAPDVFWLFFDNELPDALYGVNIGTSSGMARVTDRQTDHLEITVDSLTEPYTLFVQIFRTV